jgi:hypothetical protein
MLLFLSGFIAGIFCLAVFALYYRDRRGRRRKPARRTGLPQAPLATPPLQVLTATRCGGFSGTYRRAEHEKTETKEGRRIPPAQGQVICMAGKGRMGRFNISAIAYFRSTAANGTADTRRRAAHQESY